MEYSENNYEVEYLEDSDKDFQEVLINEVQQREALWETGTPLSSRTKNMKDALWNEKPFLQTVYSPADLKA